MRLLLHAPNVHQGGGRILLSSLLRCAADSFGILAILDSRFEPPSELSSQQVVMQVPPTLWGRLLGEKKLKSLATAEMTILCFGNLPPLLNCRGRTLLFLQNRYLTGGLDASGFSWRTRLRILAERSWLRFRIGNVDEVIVQSNSMARDVERAFGVCAKVLSFVPMPLTLETSASSGVSTEPARFDFLYVASGEPHKNHDRLLEAWRLLAEEGVKPTLGLTLDPVLFSDLVARIERSKNVSGLHIENIGKVSNQATQALYRSARAMIYPSLGESLGLPLLEARESGLPIIAAEKDYVRDLIDPVETFDPYSAVSIARAVKRFLDIPRTTQPILTPQQFLEAILPD